MYVPRKNAIKQKAFTLTVNSDFPVIQLNVLDAQGCLNIRIRDAIYFQVMNAIENMARKKDKAEREKFVGDAGLAKLLHDADAEVDK